MVAFNDGSKRRRRAWSWTLLLSVVGIAAGVASLFLIGRAWWPAFALSSLACSLTSWCLWCRQDRRAGGGE